MKSIKRIWFCLVSLVILYSVCLHCFCASLNYMNNYLAFQFLNSHKVTECFLDRQVSSGLWGKLNSYHTISSSVEDEKVNNLSFSTSAISDEYGSIYDQLYTVSAYVYYWVKLDTGETVTSTSAKRSTTGYCVTSEISATAGEDFDEKCNVKDFQSRHMFDQRLAKIQIEFAPGEIWRDMVIYDPMQQGPNIVYPIIRN